MFFYRLKNGRSFLISIIGWLVYDKVESLPRAVNPFDVMGTADTTQGQGWTHIFYSHAQTDTVAQDTPIEKDGTEFRMLNCHFVTAVQRWKENPSSLFVLHLDTQLEDKSWQNRLKTYGWSTASVLFFTLVVDAIHSGHGRAGFGGRWQGTLVRRCPGASEGREAFLVSEVRPRQEC